MDDDLHPLDLPGGKERRDAARRDGGEGGQGS
jgi:hypothetical protein